MEGCDLRATLAVRWLGVPSLLPPAPPPVDDKKRVAQRATFEAWSDADKVALVSGLTIPFAIMWVFRMLAVQRSPALAPYIHQGFLPALIPFLWVQLAGHVVLALVAFAVRKRLPRRVPWLVHAEIQLWCACAAFSIYAVGTFTHPYAVLLLVVPVVGYLLFPPRAVHYGMLTLGVGTALGVVLPMLHLVPYGPFLDRAPFHDGVIPIGWVLASGLPTFFAMGVAILVHERLVRELRVRQAELEVLSSTDALTGLWNRAVFFTRLEEEIARARRHAHPLSVLMIDVDHFKAVNDTHGHAVGDRVLRELAATVRKNLRTGDLAARYGGEELAVLLPHTKLEHAQAVAARLNEEARAVRLGDEGRKHVTVSIGVSMLEGEENADQLVARADEALYDAKRAGRDRVEASVPPLARAPATARTSGSTRR
jgi:diguanylate cyclase (GGDEF)-like protein